jgi:endonuclease/exonuclease/phosphatase family metal-dependent hydrolase
VARLDRIFASPDLSAKDAGVHRSVLAMRASDHLPVWATLSHLPKKYAKGSGQCRDNGL